MPRSGVKFKTIHKPPFGCAFEVSVAVRCCKVGQLVQKYYFVILTQNEFNLKRSVLCIKNSTSRNIFIDFIDFLKFVKRVFKPTMLSGRKSSSPNKKRVRISETTQSVGFPISMMHFVGPHTRCIERSPWGYSFIARPFQRNGTNFAELAHVKACLPRSNVLIAALLERIMRLSPPQTVTQICLKK